MHAGAARGVPPLAAQPSPPRSPALAPLGSWCHVAIPITLCHTPHCRSAPAVSAQGLLPTTGSVDVTPPSVGEPWDHYLLHVCPVSGGPCLQPLTCSPVVAPPALTTCPLAGLQAGTQYSVNATAVKAGGTSSKTSEPATFSTPTDE